MDEHTQAIKQSLHKWQKLEDELRRIGIEESNAAIGYKMAQKAIAAAIENQKAHIQELLKSTGEYEVDVPGDEDDTMDYKIGFSSSRDKLDLVDEKAVPKEFIRTKEEKSVMKKELLDHLKGLRDSGRDLPNWASIGKTNVDLQWRAVKKSN